MSTPGNTAKLETAHSNIQTAQRGSNYYHTKYHSINSSKTLKNELNYQTNDIKILNRHNNFSRF